MINEIRENSEEILVLSKHLEDMLKELFFEAELKKQEGILNLHKRMYKKVRDIKKKVILTNTKISELTTEYFQYDIHKEDYR